MVCLKVFEKIYPRSTCRRKIKSYYSIEPEGCFLTMKMKFTKLLSAFVGILFIVGVAFSGETCESKAAKKKLAGDAKASFIKKCEEDTKAANKHASREAEKKENMAGIAKGSLLKMLFSLHKLNFDG